jgi:hypothetical protein
MGKAQIQYRILNNHGGGVDVVLSGHHRLILNEVAMNLDIFLLNLQQKVSRPLVRPVSEKHIPFHLCG